MTAPRGSFTWALQRELLLARHRRADTLNLIGFFVLACLMFPFAIGPQTDWLLRIGPGVVWVAALLALLLALPRLFEQEHNDGSLELMIASGRSLTALVAGKLVAAWLAAMLPVILATPLLGLAFALPLPETGLLMLTLTLGTPTLLGLGAIAAALTLGLRSGAALVALLCLPLFVPVLIFGAGAVDMVRGGLSPTGHLALLAAGMLVTIVGAPPLVALGLRTSVE